MIGYYKYSRNEIAEIIKTSPKTNDGFYYVRKFPELNNQTGKLDNENDSIYYYSRDLFMNKYVFNDFEIECYLSEKKKNFNYDKMQLLDTKIKTTIEDFINYGLNEQIPDYEFNLNELIDTTIYFYNIKN